MRDAALRIADELAAAPTRRCPTRRSPRRRSCCAGWPTTTSPSSATASTTSCRTDERRATSLVAVPGTGLGILRADQPMSGVVRLAAAGGARARRRRRSCWCSPRPTRAPPCTGRPTSTTSASSASTPTGEVVGERRFLGPVHVAGLHARASCECRCCGARSREVLDRVRASAATATPARTCWRSWRPTRATSCSRSAPTSCYRSRIGVLHLQERRQTAAVPAPGRLRPVHLLPGLPAARPLHHRGPAGDAADPAARRSTASSVDYTARVTESVLARLHFVVRVDPARAPCRRRRRRRARGASSPRRPAPGPTTSPTRCVDAVRRGAGRASCSPATPTRSRRRTRRTSPPREAVARPAPSSRRSTSRGELDAAACTAGAAPRPASVGFKVYRVGEPLSLSAGAAGAAAHGRRGRRRAALRDRPRRRHRRPGSTTSGCAAEPSSATLAERRAASASEDAFAAVWRGEAEDDGFNALVLRAGLTWRQAMVLRAYAKYLRQAGIAVQPGVHRAVRCATYPDDRAPAGRAVRGPVRPAAAQRRRASRARPTALVEEIDRRARRRSTSLDQDRILRSFLDADPGDPAHQLLPARRGRRGRKSVRRRSSSTRSASPTCPQPRPQFEIWVYSPRVEGVHLRFGAVARGGLRWSDRREDFRTEILGLVKAQMVKNAVIVPVGAKGGFVRQAAAGRPGATARPCWPRASPATSTFIAGAARRHRQPGRRRHGRAAGATWSATTATTPTWWSPPTRAPRPSPTSPTRSRSTYGFWLGDAFASGGSAGYDHKAMGITARGAWESVKRHFRELGVDTQTAGLHRRRRRRHVRRRVRQRHAAVRAHPAGRRVRPPARLPRPRPRTRRRRSPSGAGCSTCRARRGPTTTRSLISAGGGVYPRTAKSIPITPQVRDGARHRRRRRRADARPS